MYSLVVMVISDDNYDITTHDSAKKPFYSMLIKLTFECTKKIFLHCWKLKRFITKISVQLFQPANRLITNPRQPVFTTASSWIEIISFPTTITTTFIAVKPDGPPGAKCKDTVAYWFLQSLTNVLRICRSMRLQTRSSAAPVRYLGHTPITARQRDELCRGNIFMEYSHFFEYYFVVILRLSPGRGSEQQAVVVERDDSSGDWVWKWTCLASMLMLWLLDSLVLATLSPASSDPFFFLFFLRWHHHSYRHVDITERVCFGNHTQWIWQFIPLRRALLSSC